MYPDFDEQLSQFHEFLRLQGLSQDIVWVAPQHTLFCGKRGWKIFAGEGIAQNDVRALYEDSEKAHGVRMDVLCADGKYAYCYLYIPANAEDVAQKLMGYGCVKMSVPMKVPPAARIRRGSVLAIWFQFLELKKWRGRYFHID